jgi:hypothetical protein
MSSHGLKVLDNGFTWDVWDTLKDTNGTVVAFDANGTVMASGFASEEDALAWIAERTDANGEYRYVEDFDVTEREVNDLLGAEFVMNGNRED